jgi:hypothetical protein
MICEQSVVVGNVTETPEHKGISKSGSCLARRGRRSALRGFAGFKGQSRDPYCPDQGVLPAHSVLVRAAHTTVVPRGLDIERVDS